MTWEDFLAAIAGEDLRALERGWDEATQHGKLWRYSGDKSPLMAGAHGSPRVLKFLIALGDDPTLRNCVGWTPMMHAAMVGNADGVRMYLERGLPIEQRTEAGMTPLMLSCASTFKGSLEVTKLLLERGADARVRNKALETVLCVLPLTFSWTAEATELLVAAGANVNQRQPNGSNALLRSFPDPVLSHALMRHGATFDPESGQLEAAVVLAAKLNAGDFLRYLHAEQANLKDLQPYDDPGKTLLHEAFQGDAPDAVLALLEIGIDPSSKDRAHKTAMSYAKKGPRCAQVLRSFLAQREALSALGDVRYAQADIFDGHCSISSQLR